MRWSMAGLMLTGLVAAVCAAVLVASLRAGGATVARPARDVKVVVAKRSLPAMSVVTDDAVETRTISHATEPAGALSAPLQAIGKVLTVPVTEGQVLTRNCFADGSGAHLAAVLPKGKRAVSVSLADYAGLNGLLYPGARVDVLASFRITGSKSPGTAVSTTLLQGIEVLAIEDESVVNEDKFTGPAKGAEAALKVNHKWRVTLMVDNDQAKALQLAMEHGNISLAMRNPLDQGQSDPEATLLSEGKLASYAAMLPSSVAGQLADADPVDPFKTPVKHDAAPRAPDDSWDVTIIRGSTSETKSFHVKPDPGLSSAAQP